MGLPSDKIMWLLDTFGNPRSSFFNSYYQGTLADWKPGTEAEGKAFSELIAPENRQLLRQWYARASSPLNPMAEAMRRILERETGEQLPVGGR